MPFDAIRSRIEEKAILTGSRFPPGKLFDEIPNQPPDRTYIGSEIQLTSLPLRAFAYARLLLVRGSRESHHPPSPSAFPCR